MLDRIKWLFKRLKYGCEYRSICVGCKHLEKCQFKFFIGNEYSKGCEYYGK